MQHDKIRVLQVVGGMNVGGAETWLMHVLRGIDRDRFQFEFLVFDRNEQDYEEEILALGGQLTRVASPSCHLGTVLEYFRLLRQRGPYDVIHCHTQHFSGVFAALGKMANIPIRIVHSHSDSKLANKSASWPRTLYLNVMERIIRIFSTNRFAVSDVAASALFGENWAKDKRTEIVRAGINVRPISDTSVDKDLRERLGLESDQWVVGHVARISQVKNHTFLVDVASVLSQRNCNVRFLIIGDGPLRTELESKIKSLGLECMFILTGTSSDVPNLLANAIDVFVLPSHYEGLPLSALEAQASGLPCLLSVNCSDEAEVLKGMVEFLPIDDPVLWAERIVELQDSPRPFSREDALRAMTQSPFNIQRGIAMLERRYTGRED